MNLVQSGDVSKETALEHATNPEHMRSMLESRYFSSPQENKPSPAIEPFF
jgi:hypothetical protein